MVTLTWPRQRYVLRCPVCGITVQPLNETEAHVDCEDEDGVVQWFHEQCWLTVLDDGETA